ncbi:gamma carbonic anhydrase family protein [Galbibacter sp.]|uniref:gamma carbonic anhydrase family protein n=1 Tax=Galbibacter sp. TaxID=2918471 RepID=UPI002BAB65D7|nr:gamma carbonic anhydrase family protein [Galbibacter sp.]HLV63750.1 gamma carbonic anhydrase family protein [Galbibacter sp.]
MIIKTVKGKRPEFGKDIYISENAVIVGDVITGDHCSVWFNAVIRGDVNAIRLGNKVNVQDGAVIHCTYQCHATQIGNNVSIGHNAIVHGCTIEDNVLIGMGSIVMDGCVVGQNSIIAAGAVVTQNTRIEPGSVYGGVPAKKIKEIDENLSKQEVERIANNYLKYASWFRESKEL